MVERPGVGGVQVLETGEAQRQGEERRHVVQAGVQPFPILEYGTAARLPDEHIVGSVGLGCCQEMALLGVTDHDALLPGTIGGRKKSVQMRSSVSGRAQGLWTVPHCRTWVAIRAFTAFVRVSPEISHPILNARQTRGSSLVKTFWSWVDGIGDVHIVVCLNLSGTWEGLAIQRLLSYSVLLRMMLVLYGIFIDNAI